MMFYEEINGCTIPMSIETKLLKERTIILSGEINTEMANKIVAELLCLDSMNHDDMPTNNHQHTTDSEQFEIGITVHLIFQLYQFHLSKRNYILF